MAKWGRYHCPSLRGRTARTILRRMTMLQMLMASSSPEPKRCMFLRILRTQTPIISTVICPMQAKTWAMACQTSLIFPTSPGRSRLSQTHRFPPGRPPHLSHGNWCVLVSMGTGMVPPTGWSSDHGWMLWVIQSRDVCGWTKVRAPRFSCLTTLMKKSMRAGFNFPLGVNTIRPRCTCLGWSRSPSFPRYFLRRWQRHGRLERFKQQWAPNPSIISAALFG